MNARAKVDVWAVDSLRSWCALDYAREYIDLVQRLDSLGFTGEDIGLYRHHLVIQAVDGVAPMEPRAWRLAHAFENGGAAESARECLSNARSAIALMARHLDCPPSVLEAAAPGTCRQAFEAFQKSLRRSARR